MKRLNGLSLFSGIGGIELGLKDYVQTKAYCEIDPYACAVLRSRMSEGLLDQGEIYGDIRKLHFEQGSFDIITGGFPCQDISNAGKRKGINAERSGLWFEMARLTDEIRPKYLFVENVSAIINRGLPEVLSSLAKIGYDAEWTTIRASDVGAPHRRERFFMLGYPEHAGRVRTEVIGEDNREQLEEKTEQELSCDESARGSCLWQKTINVAHPVRHGHDEQAGQAQGEQERGMPTEPANHGTTTTREPCAGVQQGGNTQDVPDSSQERCGGRENTNRVHGQGMAEQEAQEQPILRGETTGRDRNPSGLWDKDPADLDPEAEPYVGRVANGTPHRVDRIKCLGNAVVPAQAREAYRILMELKA